MNIEILITAVVAIATATFMMSAFLKKGASPELVGKIIYAAAASFVLGYIGGGFTNVLGDPQMGMLIGIIVGQILAYTNLLTCILKFIWKWIKKFFKWIWSIATWWVKAIIIVAITAIVLWFFVNHII